MPAPATTPQPRPLLAKLAKPTSAYKRRAWLAVGALALFVTLYFGLAAWFLHTAYRLTFGTHAGGDQVFWGWLIGACAAFLAVFMLKAVFFVKHGGSDDHIEITREQQPELFRFLYRVADKAGAPRPHKVVVSPRVNAAVFYDLSIINLFFPSRKNLEIGLGLVNSLSLGEFHAVLAHEFGHFAQRAMAVGRWVYMAQQIAGHLVARRDKLDEFLRALSHFDPRIAWVGWILSLIVWSIRSLVDSVFHLVVLVQRALSREMEMNADLVAVSLTGSDALIHALHRLQAADDAWGRAVGFVLREKAKGKFTRDLFAIQAQVVSHMGQLLNDPGYGLPPGADATQPKEHRVFKAELAQPPQMWLTHPLNHEREANAKRHYVHAPIDERPAWSVFADAQALREQVTAKLLGPSEATPESTESSLQVLTQQFEREHFKSRYRGIYFGRSIVRCARELPALYEACATPTAQDLDALYPPSLVSDMERLRTLEKELAQLQALHSGRMRPPDGVIQHRETQLKRAQLPQAIAQVERDLAEVQARLHAHDRRCRSLHRAAAAPWGMGWAEYLQGLLAALHLADHCESNLLDLQGMLRNSVQIATATRKVNAKGVTNILGEASRLHAALTQVYQQAAGLVLDTTLHQRLGDKTWAEALGSLGLPVASKENLSEWLQAVDSWVEHTAGTCGALRTHALEQLLLSESTVAGHVRTGSQPQSASAATKVPADFDRLLLGAERKRQTQLHWWDRFQVADGVVPATARLAAAGGIVAAVLGLGGTVGGATVVVYNGLARSVLVDIGPARNLHIARFGSTSLQVEAGSRLKIVAHTEQGQVIEEFNADVQGSFGQFVYSVAGAAPLVEWTATYGNAAARPERMLGAPRWISSSAGTLFSEPPQSISTKGGGGTREVLSGMGGEAPQQELGMLQGEAEQLRLAATRARWDALDSHYIGHWLAVARASPEHPKILAARLAEAPDDVLLLRQEQDSVGDAQRAAVCERHRVQAAATPQSVNLQYVVARCLPDGPARDRAFVDGHASHPQHGWFAYAAGSVEAEHAHWQAALAAFDLARRTTAPLAETVAVDMARIKRLLKQDDTRSTLTELGQQSHALRRLLALESGQGIDAPVLKAYVELGLGRVDKALGLSDKTPEARARMLRLAAASDGADSGLIAKALALPADKGLDESTVWPSLALAAREKRDLSAFEPLLRRVSPTQYATMLKFVNALATGTAPADAAGLLEGLPTELRGQAYSAGVVLLGQKAPTAWRDAAKRLLFTYERPYFS